MNKYTNRYGDEYWFDEMGANQYLFRMEGDSMKWCRFGSHEMQEGVDKDDLGFFDPFGGPFIEVGMQLPFGKVKNLRSVDDGILITVE